MSRTIALPLLAAAALAACQPANLSGTNPNQNRNTGAIAGAAIGAAASGLAGNGPGTNAVAAVGGAILGAGIGEMLDRQAADLRNDIGNSDVTVTNTGDRLLVNFPDAILFATDSAAVSGGAQDELRGLARNLQNYPDTVIEVIGHTDNTGSAAHNFDLSARRAGAVSSVLVGAGVPGSRVTATGRGEDQPVASNLTPEGRAQNRRVEVVIRPTA